MPTIMTMEPDSTKSPQDHEPSQPLEVGDPVMPVPFGRTPRTGGAIVLFVLMLVGMIIVGGICQFYLGFKLNALITELVVILLPILWILRRIAPVRRLRLATVPRAGTLLTAVIGVLGLALLLAEFTHWSDKIFPMPTVFKQAYLQAITANSVGELLLLLLAAAVAPGFCEEVAFRGYFQQIFDHRYGRRQGIVFAAALFALMHLDPWHLPALFLIGLYLGALFAWTGSLWVPIAAHFSNNAASVLMVYAMPDVSLSQMSEPPPAWALIMGAVMFAWAVWRLRRHARDLSPKTPVVAADGQMHAST